MADNDDLTDDQMLQLLRGAEARMRAKTSETILLSSDNDPVKLPKIRLSTGELARPYAQQARHGSTAVRRCEAIEGTSEPNKYAIRKVEDPVTVRKRAEEKKKATAGEQWYNLPKTDLTPELKRDLQVLKMRNVLNPHRHYKKEGGKMKAPEYSQVGTIIEGPTEYYSARINNKDRKQTFIEEVLAGEKETGRFKRKYSDLQAKKTSGKKAHYKALKAGRARSFKKS